jgi:hypothetical protein
MKIKTQSLIGCALFILASSFAHRGVAGDPVTIDDFTEGERHYSVLATGEIISETVTNLNNVVGGKRIVSIQAQTGTGASLDIGGGRASLRNLPSSQTLITLRYDVSSLSLGPANYIRVSGSDAPSDLDSYFVDESGREFEVGGDQNTWVSLANACAAAFCGRPSAISSEAELDPSLAPP